MLLSVDALPLLHLLVQVGSHLSFERCQKGCDLIAKTKVSVHASKLMLGSFNFTDFPQQLRYLRCNLLDQGILAEQIG